MQNCPCFHPLFCVPHTGRIFCLSTASNSHKSNRSKRNFSKEKKIFSFFILFFLFPRGFEESSEGFHWSAVFNVNQNLQSWVTSSLTVFFLPPPRPGSRIVTRSKIASYTPNVIARPLCVRNLLFFHVYEEDSAVKYWNVCEINSSRVSSFPFVSGNCTMKVYFWGRRLFFFYIGGRGCSVIRRSLVVNLCQSVLERHNEHETAAECRCVTADLKCKALRAVKRARSVQGPTLSADAIENFGTQSSLVRVTLRHASPLKDQAGGHFIGFSVLHQSGRLLIVFPPAQWCLRGHFCCSFSLFFAFLSISWIQPLTINVIWLVWLVWERVGDRGRI